MYQVALEMYVVVSETHLRERGRKLNFWCRATPPAHPHQHASAMYRLHPLYKRAGSVSVGLGLSSSPPIAVEMYHVAFEMKLRIPRCVRVNFPTSISLQRTSVWKGEKCFC